MRVLTQFRGYLKNAPLLLKIFLKKGFSYYIFDAKTLIFKSLAGLKWKFRFYIENDRELVRSDIKSITNLVVCVTFHFSVDRLIYLDKVTSSLDNLANNVRLFIVTNTDEKSNLELIREYTKTRKFTISSSLNLEHPFLLTQEHVKIFRNQYEENENVSHFMYLEDDIFITRNNIDYWLYAREDLKQFGLIPSFLRYEISAGDLQLRSTDVPRTQNLKNLPKIKFNSKYWYINFQFPYQGMYLLDRELAKEYLFGNHQIDERIKKWGIRERSAAGLTFIKIPKDFSSRNLVGFYLDKFCVDNNALIHHLPNNYANNPDTVYGKLKIDKVIH
jgi:hypothetical protein